MYYIHLKTIEQLVATYKQEQPLIYFIKSFFRANKKFGSRDRKVITQNIFNYYRLGKALGNLDFNARLAVVNYLMDGDLSDNITTAGATLEDRLSVIKELYNEFNLNDLFSFNNQLSVGIDSEAYNLSILKRPKVFIRIRSGFADNVEAEFTTSEFQFDKIGATTFSLDNETKLTETESYKKGYFEIQDLSSQHTGNFFEANKNEEWWDGCAGAGGKSLLFKDKFPKVNLLISDVRDTILKNAEERLKKANATNFEIETIDLNYKVDLSNESEDAEFVNQQPATVNQFDGIIIDAPCTGSGTWARTPDAISFFKPEWITDFQANQIAIAKNALQYLKPGGQFIYITCSAFKKENEDVVKHLVETTDLKLIKSELIIGYEKQADTMFAALLVLEK